MQDFVVDMEVSLEAIAKWLIISGLAVKDWMMELCVFHNLDQLRIKIKDFNSAINLRIQLKS